MFLKLLSYQIFYIKLTFFNYYYFIGTYDARWRVLILYITRVFDLDINTVDNFELNVVNCLSNFLPAQTE